MTVRDLRELLESELDDAVVLVQTPGGVETELNVFRSNYQDVPHVLLVGRK